MKVVINTCGGGFGLSHKATMRYFELKNIVPKVEENPHHLVDYLYYVDGEHWREHDINREDTALIQVIEEFGKEANGRFAELKIVEIPDGIEYYIDEFSGAESIHEKHRIWR